MAKSPSKTHFLNVDFEIYAKLDLQPLVNQLGRKVIVLYAGRVRGQNCVILEIAKHSKTADSTIRAFCRLIEALPEAERSLWNTATLRSFSIGIQTGVQPNSMDFAIRPQTPQNRVRIGGPGGSYDLFGKQARCLEMLKNR